MKIGIQDASEKRGMILTEMLLEEGLEVTAFNDRNGVEAVRTALKNQMEISPGFNVNSDGYEFFINGNPIRITGEEKAEDILWGKSGVQIVELCSGRSLSESLAMGHSFNTNVDGDTANDTNVEYIISSGEVRGVKHLVVGINHEDFTLKDKVVTVGSPLARAMAFPLKALTDHSGIRFSSMDYLAIIPKVPSLGYVKKTNIQLGFPEVGSEVKQIVPKLDCKIKGYAFEVDTPEGTPKAGWVQLTLYYSDQEGISTNGLTEILKDAESNYEGRLGIIRTLGPKAIESDQKKLGYKNRSNKYEMAMVPLENPGLQDITIREYSKHASVVVLPRCSAKFTPTGGYAGDGDEEELQGVGIIKLLIGYDQDTASAFDQALLTKYIVKRVEEK